MRFIKADELKNDICDMSVSSDEVLNTLYKLEVIDVIDSQPIVDAVEVVRCKDCKWRRKFGCAVRVMDESDIPKDNDFCSWGEKMDEVEDDLKKNAIDEFKKKLIDKLLNEEI